MRSYVPSPDVTRFAVNWKWLRARLVTLDN